MARWLVYYSRDPGPGLLRHADRDGAPLPDVPQDLKTLVASHRGSIVIATSAENLLQIVGSTRGAIGLVDVYSITHDVKVLKIDDKLPLEAGYLLRGK